MRAAERCVITRDGGAMHCFSLLKQTHNNSIYCSGLVAEAFSCLLWASSCRRASHARCLRNPPAAGADGHCQAAHASSGAQPAFSHGTPPPDSRRPRHRATCRQTWRPTSIPPIRTFPSSLPVLILRRSTSSALHHALSSSGIRGMYKVSSLTNGCAIVASSQLLFAGLRCHHPCVWAVLCPLLHDLRAAEGEGAKFTQQQLRRLSTSHSFALRHLRRNRWRCCLLTSSHPHDVVFTCVLQALPAS